MNYDLVGLGNALLDFQVEVKEETLKNLDATKGGMTLVEPNYQLRTLSVLREEFGNKEIQVSSGGSAANTLAGFASYGGKSLLIGKIGSDDNGRAYKEDAQRVGVDFHTHKESATPTGTCLALITPDAERTMLTSLGAAIELSTEDLNIEAIKNSEYLYIEGYLWDSPSAREACIEAINIAKAAGKKVAFTFSDAFCVDRHKDDFVKLAKEHIDILFCNEHEAKATLDTATPDEAFQEMKAWVDYLCVSTGPKGALVSEDKGAKTDQVPTWDIKLVDKLGAGDLFASGVLFGLARGKTLRECAYLGCYSATRVIQQMSARLDSPLQENIDEALAGPSQVA